MNKWYFHGTCKPGQNLKRYLRIFFLFSFIFLFWVGVETERRNWRWILCFLTVKGRNRCLCRAQRYLQIRVWSPNSETLNSNPILWLVSNSTPTKFPTHGLGSLALASPHSPSSLLRHSPPSLPPSRRLLRFFPPLFSSSPTLPLLAASRR